VEKIGVTGELPKHILEAMQKDSPSTSPEYWAKSSCKHCCGRVEIGEHTLAPQKSGTMITHKLLCICARKNWKKWQDNWLEERLERVFI